MTLHVHRGPHLAPLAGALADILATPPDDPFTPDVVAVPTAGIRDWLRRFVAGRLGVAANIEMPFPARFVATALGQPAGDHDDPWAIDRVTWAILEVIDRSQAAVPVWPDDGGTGATSRYVVARRVADLFDRYAANRPQLVQQWAAGIPGDGTVSTNEVGGSAGVTDDGRVTGLIPEQMRWQFDLWRAVRTAIAEPNPAEQLPATLARLTAGDMTVDLPARVALFGISTVTPVQIDVVRALGVARDVHVFVVHPSPAAWDATPPLPSDRLIIRQRAGDQADDGDGNPLLRTWGRLTFEAAGLLRGIPDAVVHAHEGVHAHDGGHAHGGPVGGGEPATLLGHIQNDLISNQAPRARADASIDQTVQVHASHGAVRQLEVLRDVLDGLFVADPSLQPRDIAVLCPDLDRFAPFASTVFGRGTLPVPVSVTDLTLDTDNPVAAALVTIVGVLAGRCGALEVLDLAALEPVRQRVGLTVDDLERFGNWVDDLGTRWGLDSQHRIDWDHGDVLDGTWSATIDALLLGVLMPAPSARQALDGVVPFDDLGATEMRQAGLLADLLERLRRSRKLLAGRRPIGEWCDRLVEILTLLCRAEPGRAWQMASVTAAIERLRTDAIVSGRSSTGMLSLADVGAVVGALVGGVRGRLRLRSGSVTVTDLVPVRNVPARVVCLLGFDESSLRVPSVDGDDVLAVQPCVGERDRRGDHRHVLLDAVMAAGEHLVITCDGSDLTTNRRIRSPIQLAELLDVLDTTIGVQPSESESDHPTMTRHPRRAYDERIFGGGPLTAAPSGRAAAPSGFDDSMLRAAEARRTLDAAGHNARPNRFDVPLPLVVPGAVTLDDLAEACARPARVLLRDGLDVRLPGEASSRDEHVPLEASPFDAAGLGRDLLKLVRSSDDAFDAVVASWSDAQRRVGRLPPRRLADHTLASIEQELNTLLAAAVGGAAGLAFARAGGAVDISLALAVPPWAKRAAGRREPPVPATVPLIATIGSVLDDTAADVLYERYKPRHLIAAVLRLAALVVTEPNRSWQTVVVARTESQSTKPAILWVTVQPDAGAIEAQALLDTAFDLRLEALRRRVPLFEKTSLSLHRTGQVNDDDLFGTDYAFGADLTDEHAAFVWDGITVDDLEARDPSIRQLASRLWRTVETFAVIPPLASSAKRGASKRSVVKAAT